MVYQVRLLNELSITLRHEFPPAKPAPVDERCFICHRAFGVKDDPGDPDEVACTALQFLPCRHLVGSECVDDMLKSTALRNVCPLCGTPLQSATLFEWARKMSETYSFVLVECELAMLVHKNPRMTSTFHSLTDRLFEEDLTPLQALKLWGYHVGVALYLFAIKTGLYLSVYIICWVLGCFLAGLYPELSLASPLSSYPIDTPLNSMMLGLLLVALIVFIVFIVVWHQVRVPVHGMAEQDEQGGIRRLLLLYEDYQDVFGPLLALVLLVVNRPLKGVPALALGLHTLASAVLYSVITGILISHGIRQHPR
ncbi:uncharacterized protein K460DRAFT_410759 [Cucurbitaria berberidis CBS 394.84]|uniref:RING-type domain-containing protein n=1 Tax=Cucurbitaria berberidis CBS 394.84 TaxID=1168544 RepID=A0A9P4L3U6_9PLEO|nr:uncharacterized protein K460DRAFT_410759 [Cucurbitaria berberidis CBS 394.84]KAF1840158.1 hypothetical protein K460DRAFT_410759 [Cucurbitaria berberidis CBS 394.84]